MRRMVKMDLKIKNFGLVRHLDFLKENILIMFKLVTEFKTNFYSIVLERTVYLFVNILLFSILFNNFGSVIGWEFSDFILFLLLVDFFAVLLGIVTWKSWIRYEITLGGFNSSITKPINIFWFNYIHTLSYYGLLYTILTFFISIVFILYFNIVFMNIFLGISLFLLIGFFWLSISEFFRSLDWIMIGLSGISWTPFRNLNQGFKNFPSPFFKNFEFKFLFFLFPNFLIAYLLLPILKGDTVINLMNYVWFLVIGSIVLITCTSIVWRYGLS